MKIKKGDLVRVSGAAPKIYLSRCDGFYAAFAGVVIDIEGDHALIKSSVHIEPTTELAIPTKYLVKVDAEAKEPKFKKGDKVRYIGNDQPEYRGSLFIIDGDVFFNDHFNQWQASSIKIKTTDTWGICNVPLSDLVLCTERTAPAIKVGDRVRNKSYAVEAVVLGIDGDYIAVRRDDGIKQEWKISMTELVEPMEQTEAEEDVRIRQMEAELDEFRKAELDRILHPEKYYTYEVTVNNVAMDWPRYEADLAKELAIAYGKRGKSPLDAVAAAKEITKRLKQK